MLQGPDRRHGDSLAGRHRREQRHLDGHHHGSSHRLRCQQARLRERSNRRQAVEDRVLTHRRSCRQGLHDPARRPQGSSQRIDEPRQPTARQPIDKDNGEPCQVLQCCGQEQDEQRRTLPRGSLLPVRTLPDHRSEPGQQHPRALQPARHLERPQQLRLLALRHTCRHQRADELLAGRPCKPLGDAPAFPQPYSGPWSARLALALVRLRHQAQERCQGMDGCR